VLLRGGGKHFCTGLDHSGMASCSYGDLL